MSAATIQPTNHSTQAGLSSPHPAETHQRAGGISHATTDGVEGAKRKPIVIGTKAQADKVLVESLFKPVDGKTLKRERYDMGKYAHNHKGQTVEVSTDIAALWMERREDLHGVYWALFCLSAA